ncbi:hypothetical protein T440DRAFT_473430 [Plenodomus tracheiphilus IPT5]|uniref:F-box domain-containing protein n=1 Tax=Plenodomus tracheiphilus IPT5 TaxID=1408161 RepID=A0A6A7AMW9_9PLEO|nr:hypothetical protein T440DRAFT_473430 [Plenodomus tracheiphilus IPT5]
MTPTASQQHISYSSHSIPVASRSVVALHCVSMYLPTELWDSIFKYLDLPDLKECRLVNIEFRCVATPLVFETVSFSFTKPRVRTFDYIGAREPLARSVKTIILRQGPDRGYRAFSSRESWERNLRCTDVVGSDNASGDDHTMASKKWANMTSAEREALYNEYEKDRSTLRLDKDDFLRTVVRSLERMSNLLTFWHEPTKYDEMDWKCEWRGLRFRQDDDDDDDDYDHESWAYSQEIEHDIDSLHTALFLQALGSMQSPRSLETISFEIHGPGFWTPARLRHLWEGYGHLKIRRLREKYQDAVIADQVLDEGVDDTAIEDYSTQLNTLQSIFGRVESIDISVVESYSVRSLDTIAEPLSRFLRLGKNLKDVRLVYGNFHTYYKESYSELSEYRNNYQNLLAQLAIKRLWPAVVTLQISIATDTSTLLDFLEAIASTLRTLWLDSVTLLPGDSERGTWESVLPCIPGTLSKIERLLLDDLNDFRTDGSTRKLFHSSSWKCKDCYEEYKNIIVRDVLCERKVRHSLEQDMSSDCEHQ